MFINPTEDNQHHSLRSFIFTVTCLLYNNKKKCLAHKQSIRGAQFICEKRHDFLFFLFKTLVNFMCCTRNDFESILLFVVRLF